MSQPPSESRKESDAELFRLLVENVKDYAVFVIDPEGRVQNWNPGAQRLLGYAEAEIIGQSADIFFTPEDRQAGVPDQEMRQAIDDGRGNDDRWHVRKDGSRFWSGGVMTPLWDEVGKLRGFAKIMRDRTDRKLADQARLQSEARQATILETALDAIITIDHEGRVVEFNPAAEALFGYAMCEVRGRDIAELIVPPHLRQAHQQGMARYLSTGEGPVLGKRIEMPALRADGSEITVELAITRIPTSGPPQFTAYLRDISDWTRSEQHRNTRLAVTHALNEATNIQDGANDVLKAVCENLGWDVGFFWRVNESSTELRCVGDWHLPDESVLNFKSASSRFTFAPGEGLPGRVWASGIPAWILDISADERFPRLSSAVESGLHSAFACPVAVGDRTLGVMEFFNRRIREPDANLLELMGTVAGNVGHFIERRAAEEQVNRSEERFRGLMEQAPFSIQVFSPQGLAIRVNRAWEDLWGVTLDQIAGYNVLEDRQLEAKGVLDFIRRGFAGETAHVPAIQYDPNVSIPNRTRHDDPRRWVAAVIYPLRDSSGQITEVVLVHDDITARKRAEEALHEAHQELESRVVERTVELMRANEFLKALLENVQTGVVACDAAGVLTLFNSVTRELHGLSEEPIPSDQWAERYRLFQSDGHTPMTKGDVPLYRALEGERVQDAEMVIVPYDAPAKTVLTSGRAFFDSEGNKLGAVVSMQDITARKHAEEQVRKAHDELERRVGERTEELALANKSLQESEEKLRLLADTIPQLAWMARPDGHIFWYNRRWHEYTGTTPEEMEGWGWQSVHDPDVLPDVLDRWQESIATGEPFEMIFPLRGADRRFRTFLTRVNPLRDGAGRIVYWFGTNTDISEIKRMEDALRENDRRKDEFLATLAHELRNPLAPIRNSLQILKMPRVDAEMARQTREMMERQVHHLVRLVDDLLDVSRVMRGKIELRREPVELANVVARAVETVQPLIEVQGHRLEISLSSESLLLDADPVRLAQVVGNLLTNSAKYSEANGHIWLTARREGGEAVLSVRDSGIGIAPDMLPHVFDLFVQADHASTKAQGGLGIGLTLVKNLVEMHGGSVEAHSGGLGAGSEFTVRLPRVAQESPEAVESGVSEQRQVKSSGYRLLVVDDNQDAAMSLAMLLRLQGHQAKVAHDGVSALKLASEYCPILVFLDLGMPMMDGYEVARRLRQTPGLENVILAALTGWGQQEDRRRTSEAGFDHHLVKPIEPKSLESILAALQHRKT